MYARSCCCWSGSGACDVTHFLHSLGHSQHRSSTCVTPSLGSNPSTKPGIQGLCVLARCNRAGTTQPMLTALSAVLRHPATSRSCTVLACLYPVWRVAPVYQISALDAPASPPTPSVHSVLLQCGVEVECSLSAVLAFPAGNQTSSPTPAEGSCILLPGKVAAFWLFLEVWLPRAAVLCFQRIH